MPTYAITAPNGKTLEITGDHVPNEAELHDIFAKAGVSTATLAETRMPAGVPARGRGTQFDPEKAQRGVDFATTPLAHPTGVDAIDSMTSPIGIASLGLGAASVARAGIAGGAVAGAKALATEASPYAKFHLTKTTLVAMGVPPWMAEAAAYALSGSKRGGKPTEPVETVPTGEHLDLSKPMRPSELTPQQLSERIKYGTGTPTPAPAKAPIVARAAPPVAAPVEPVASNPGAPIPPSAPATQSVAPPLSAESPLSAPQKSPQMLLNEEALARRQAEYQARQAAAAAQPPPAPAKFVPTREEMAEYMKLLKAGKSPAAAGQAILAQRALRTQFDLSTPTAEQTRFPKGMRGKVPE